MASSAPGAAKSESVAVVSAAPAHVGRFRTQKPLAEVLVGLAVPYASEAAGVVQVAHARAILSHQHATRLDPPVVVDVGGAPRPIAGQLVDMIHRVVGR